MKRIVFVGLLMAVATPAAWADCHLPKAKSLADAKARDIPCFGPLHAFVGQPHTGPGAAEKLAALWADTAQAEVKDPLGFTHRGRAGIQRAFQGTPFTALLAGTYRVLDGTISHDHLRTSREQYLEDAGVLEWDATIDGAPGGGRHHVRAVVVDADRKDHWLFHSVQVTAPAVGR